MGNEQKLIQLFKSLLYISEANRSHTSRYDFTLNSAQLQRGNRIWKKHRSWKMARISCSEFPSGHATYIIRSLSMFKIDQTQNRANFQREREREREREGERGREREREGEREREAPGILERKCERKMKGRVPFSHPRFQRGSGREQRKGPFASPILQPPPFTVCRR